MVQHFPLLIDGHNAGKSQPVLSFVQGTDPVGQAARQHGNHPVHQIHGGSPLKRFPVQRAPLLYIICHIRDMDAQDILTAVHLQRDRVIQILGVLAVNGHHLHIPQIRPSLHVRLTDPVRHPLRLAHDFLGKFYRKIVTFHNGQYVCTRVTDMAQDLHDLPFRTLSVRPVGDQFHHYLVAVHGSSGIFFRHKDIPGIPLIVRDHEPEIPALLIKSDDPVCSALYDPVHRAFPAFPALSRFHRDLYRVLMHGAVDLILRDKHILLHTVHRHEAEAFGMRREDSRQEYASALLIFPFLRHFDLPLLQKRVQHLLQFLAPFFRNLQKNRHLLDLHRHIEIAADQSVYHFFFLF